MKSYWTKSKKFDDMHILNFDNEHSRKSMIKEVIEWLDQYEIKHVMFAAQSVIFKNEEDRILFCLRWM
jgi:hypothetical protein